ALDAREDFGNERRADEHRQGGGGVEARAGKEQRAERGRRPPHPVRHHRRLEGLRAVWRAGALDAATLRRGALDRIEHRSRHRNRYRQHGTHAGIGDRARTLGRRIAKIAGLLTREDQYVRLTPPKQVTFYLSISLALISVLIETKAVTGLTLGPTGSYYFCG